MGVLLDVAANHTQARTIARARCGANFSLQTDASPIQVFYRFKLCQSAIVPSNPIQSNPISSHLILARQSMAQFPPPPPNWLLNSASNSALTPPDDGDDPNSEPYRSNEMEEEEILLEFEMMKYRLHNTFKANKMSSSGGSRKINSRDHERVRPSLKSGVFELHLYLLPSAYIK